MIAAPKATSHGDGGAATAGAFAAFTGMSEANAGAAADTASAATSDTTTFFIEPAPSRFDRISADTSPRPCVPNSNPGAIDPDATGRALRGVTHLQFRSGKAKISAGAAFLGVQGPCRQE